MNQVEFINAIKTAVAESTEKALLSTLVSPPGRQPNDSIVKLSTWYNSLNSDDKSMITKVVREAVDTTVFGVLCVLDGVRAIEDVQEKGELKLIYQKGSEVVLLNDPNEDHLHNLW